MNAWQVEANGQRRVVYGWSVALVVLLVSWLLALGVFWPSVKSISHIWFNSETYAHGVIIFPLALYLAWTRRRDLQATVPQPSPWGLLWLAAAGLIWMLARTAGVEMGQHFALVAVLPGLVITLLGTHIARLLIFPLAYLFFAVPFGNFIVPYLQEYTAWFAVWMLKVSGLPVFKEGYYISIPAGDFVVAEVCSGVRYLIASIALGLIFAYISYRSLWRRAALIALAVLLPIVANGLRAYGIIMIAHWTNMQHAVGVDHLIYGWLFFGLVMLLLFWLGSLWREPAASRTDAPIHSPATAKLGPWYSSALLIALLGTLIAPRSGELWLQQQASEIVETQPPALPVAVNGWKGHQQTDQAWRPEYYDADAQLVGRYRQVNEDVTLYLYQYLNRGAGTELISWRNRLFDSETWHRIGQSQQQFEARGGEYVAVQEILLRGKGARRLVWYWYQVGNAHTTRPVEVKLREALAILAGDGRGAFLVAASTEVNDSVASARERLQRFAQVLPQPLGYINE